MAKKATPTAESKGTPPPVTKASDGGKKPPKKKTATNAASEGDKPKKKRKRVRFAIGEPEEDRSQAFVFGSFTPMVAIIRAKTHQGLPDETGIVPLYYCGEDGKIKANVILEIIRWCPERSQFMMERRVFFCPIDRHGREIAKNRQVRVEHNQTFQIGKIILPWRRKNAKGQGESVFRGRYHSEMRPRAREYLSADVEANQELLQIPYSMTDLREHKDEPEALQALPKVLPDFRIYAPEKCRFQEFEEKRTEDGKLKEVVKTITATPRFHGEIQFTQVKDRTADIAIEKGLLDITGLEVDCHSLVLQADIVRLLAWTPVHVSALANEVNGYRVEALDRRKWAYTSVAPMTDKEQRIDLCNRWRQLVAEDELLSKYQEDLEKIHPATINAAVIAERLEVFEQVKGIGPKTAEKIVAHLFDHEFIKWYEDYPILPGLVSEKREKWEAEDAEAAKAEAEKDAQPVGTPDGEEA